MSGPHGEEIPTSEQLAEMIGRLDDPDRRFQAEPLGQRIETGPAPAAGSGLSDDEMTATARAALERRGVEIDEILDTIVLPAARQLLERDATDAWAVLAGEILLSGHKPDTLAALLARLAVRVAHRPDGPDEW